MINLMIVDDEAISRNRIYKNIINSDLKVDNIYTAENGCDALKKINGLRINILLTDVKMPKMNGIDLANQIREIFPDCKIIFFSGYSEIDYLKSAIKLHAIEYLEKPVKTDELYNVIKVAIESCVKDSNLINLNNFYQDSIPIVQKNLCLFLTRFNVDKEKTLNLLKLSNLENSQNCFFRTAILKIITDDVFEVHTSAEKLLTTLSENECIKFIFNFKESNTLIIHFFAERQNDLSNDRIKGVLSDFIKALNVKCLCAAGDMVSGIFSVPESYQSATIALWQCFFYEYNEIVFNRETEQNEYTFDETVSESIISNLACENFEAAANDIYTLESTVRKHNRTFIPSIKKGYCAILSQFFDFANQQHITLGAEYSLENLNAKIENANIISELTNVLIDFSKEISKNDSIGSKNFYCWKTITYIRKNFADQSLSIQSISDYLGITPTHICNIFKKNVGQTINKYIMNLRVCEAKRMLCETNMNISQVAKSVGFLESKYFCKIFKKYTNLSPSEYKQKHQVI